MKPSVRKASCLLVAMLLAAGFSSRSEAKSYSSAGGRSYSSSSHSSSSGSSRSSGSASSKGSSSASSSSGNRSASSAGNVSKSSGAGASQNPASTSGGSKKFSSSSGKSYSASSTWNDDNRRSYTSGKSYTAGSEHLLTSGSHNTKAAPALPAAQKVEPSPTPSNFTFDNAAARARKEETSKQEFTRFKESPLPTAKTPDATSGTRSETSATRSTASEAAVPPVAGPSYQVRPPPLPSSDNTTYRRNVYVPDRDTLVSRPVRMNTVYYSYTSRPVVVYRDPYNSFFWWWLLDRTLDDRAAWAFHHRYDMDPQRYQALVANDQQLEARVQQLEAQQVPRDPNYTPPGLNRDLMYSDRHVAQSYSNRPTPSGMIAFWALAVPTALGVCCFFIWLIWFKRWQTAT